MSKLTAIERAVRPLAQSQEPRPDALIAAFAHELRTPLASITCGIALLEQSLARVMDEESRYVLALVGKETRRISTLVHDWLALGRARAVRRAATDLNRLVVDAVAIARRSRPGGEPIAIEVALDAGIPHAPVDAEQMTQVLLNLLVNGLDACRVALGGAAEPRLRVSTAWRGGEGGGWTIRVADTGPGIDPADLTRVFEPFFSRKPDGTGLGLAISRRIVEAHGGRIRAESGGPGRGSVFTIVLPAGAVPVGDAE
ncbi:MAG TPA: ATP-binding protein [Thermodesulfobacteriota bacterium]